MASQGLWMTAAQLAGEFRHPVADIVALGIELLALQHRIEDAEIGRRIRARAGDPLPARGVIGEIGIDQRIPEPRLALAPVDEQMLDQERGGDHAHAIMHLAGRPQLAHAGIDDRIAGAALLPGVQSAFGSSRQGKASNFARNGLIRQIRPVIRR